MEHLLLGSMMSKLMLSAQNIRTKTSSFLTNNPTPFGGVAGLTEAGRRVDVSLIKAASNVPPPKPDHKYQDAAKGPRKIAEVSRASEEAEG